MVAGHTILTTLRSKEELAEALEAFDGTAVVISHDRWFLDRIATHVLHIEGGQADMYIGNYSYYLSKRDEERLASLEAARAAEAVKASGSAPAKAPATKAGKLSYKQAQAIDEAESAVMTLEERLKALEATLADPSTYQAGAAAADVQVEYDQVKRDLEAANDRWMALVEGL